MHKWLIKLFAGKPVRITHTSKRVADVEGACKTVHKSWWRNKYDIELEDGRRFVFVPRVFTDNWVEGDLPEAPGGRRKIQLLASCPPPYSPHSY